MKFLLYFIMVSLVLCILGSWVSRRYQESCPTAQIVYKPYVRTFIEEQSEPSYVFTMFKNMFYDNSPWTAKLGAQTAALNRGKQNPFIHGGRPKNVMSGEKNNRDDYLNTFFA
jgi:hypothetical protein